MRALRIFFISLAVLIGTFLTIVTAIVIWPQILINRHTLEFAAKIAARKGIDIHWKDLDVQVDSLALLRKKLSLDVKKLCIQVPQSGFSSCSEDFDVSVSGSFSNFTPRLLQVGPIDIRQFEWKLKQGKTDLSGRLDIEGKSAPEHELSLPQKGDVQILGSLNLPDRSKLDLRAFLNIEEDPRVKRLNLRHFNIRYFIESYYTKEKGRLTAKIQGEANPRQFYGTASGAAANFAPQVPHVSFTNCNLALNRRGSKQSKIAKGNLQLSCPIQVQVPVPIKAKTYFKIPTEVGAVLHANLVTAQYPPSLDEPLSGQIGFVLAPLLTPLFQGGGEAKANIEGVPSEFPERWKVESEMGLNVSVHQFENLVSYLQHTDWAIPAPLNVLKGELAVSTEGQADLNGINLPLTLTSRLSSQNQKLDLNGSGSFTLLRANNEFTPKVDFNLILSEVQLELPRLDWAEPPQLFPDERIVKAFWYQHPIRSKANKNAPSKFQYNLTVQTPPQHPSRVISNLAEAPVPIAFNVNISDKTPIRGNIAIGSFPIKAFRRRAVVDHLHIDLRDPIKESEINGALSFDYADYLMTVKALATIDKPIVKVSSEPPLPENQLVAALLFGQPLEQLDPDQTESVGSFRAATNGAIGLASLFVLASTPVQSMGYDTQSGVVSAKVRLAQGTSLNIQTKGTARGGSQEASSVGIQKRLGRFWTLKTDVTNSTNLTPGNVSAYLEWNHRY